MWFMGILYRQELFSYSAEAYGIFHSKQSIETIIVDQCR